MVATKMSRQFAMEAGMGTDISTIAQRKNDDGDWIDVSGGFLKGSNPFDWRSYGMFGFLADLCNFSRIVPLGPPRGLPDDFHVGEFEDGDDSWRWSSYHGASWLSVVELMAFDCDQVIEDRRITCQPGPRSWDHGHTCPPGEGETMPLREFLGDAFFRDLEMAKELGVQRIVFGFS